MQPFQTPPILHEANGEPIEQLRMGGAFALRAEIFGGLHQTGSEEALPFAIDRHASGQRMGLSCTNHRGKRQPV